MITHKKSITSKAAMPTKIYNLKTNRLVSIRDEYGTAAKRLYRMYAKAGFDLAGVLPPGLRYYAQTDRFLRTVNPVSGITIAKGRLGSYSILNKPYRDGVSGLRLIKKFKSVLVESMASQKQLTVTINALCKMGKFVDGSLITTQEMWVSSRRIQLLRPDMIPSILDTARNSIHTKIPELINKGSSGWNFQGILRMDLHTAKFKSLHGKGWVALPDELANKKAIINPQNDDNLCFQWACIAAVAPPSLKHTERTTVLAKVSHHLDFSKLEFPVQLNKIAAFERRNKHTVQVYEYDQDGARPIHLGEKIVGQPVIKLLLYESHFMTIKNFSRFVGQETTHGGNHKTHYCDYCLTAYPSQAKLDWHVGNGCQMITTCKPCMPSAEDNILKFEAFDKSIRSPYVIYADFECLTMPIQKCELSPENSYTSAYQQHEPSGFTMHEVSHRNMPPIEYRGADAVDVFLDSLQTKQEEILALTDEPMVLNAEEEAAHDAAESCYFCNALFKGKGKWSKVRDHCHTTGAYRGAAHSHCNLEEGKANKLEIPVFFHNLKNYDSHLIMSRIGDKTSKLTAIAQNFEKFISFSYDRFKFLDSAAFLANSLSGLASDMYESGAGLEKFKHTREYSAARGSEDLMHLLCIKGTYPYDYMSKWSRMDETQLPPKDAFYSKLSDSHITDAEYAHAQTVWSAFNCSTMGDYHDLYMTTDVLLLADVFEEFRRISMRDYDLDPAKFYTLPNMSWQCMLKKTGVELELLTDYDQHLMVENAIRGGISMISHRYAKANNKYLPDHDPAQETSFITYQDANNLYGHSMCQALPHKDFKFDGERDIDKLRAKYLGGDKGCFIKCDLHYPKELHDTHNCYPLAPERMLVENTFLSPYASAVQKKLDIHEDKVPKLVPNLKDKFGYVADIRNIDFYMKHGLVVTAVHQVLGFTQTAWLRPYIDFNTAKRTKATTEFEKAFYKLMNNACFGKTMENVRGHTDMDFVCRGGETVSKKDSTLDKKLAGPYYDSHVIFSPSLAAIKLKKKTVKLNKPIYAGAAVLDLSKLHMFEFHYEHIRPKYGDRAKLLMTDTDSLMYHIRTENFFEDMRRDGHLYDMSNFHCDLTSEYYNPVNKKVVGKFGEESDGAIWTEFVGLRPKMYSALSYSGKADLDEKKTGKGIARGHLKKHIRHADYLRCIRSQKVIDQQQLATFNTIRSNKHLISSLTINKVGLCCFDNKRWLLDDGVQSLSYGHHRIGGSNP